MESKQPQRIYTEVRSQRLDCVGLCAAMMCNCCWRAFAVDMSEVEVQIRAGKLKRDVVPSGPYQPGPFLSASAFSRRVPLRGMHKAAVDFEHGHTE